VVLDLADSSEFYLSVKFGQIHLNVLISHLKNWYRANSRRLLILDVQACIQVSLLFWQIIVVCGETVYFSDEEQCIIVNFIFVVRFGLRVDFCA